MKNLLNWKVIGAIIFLFINICIVFGNIPSTNPIIGIYNINISEKDEYQLIIVTNDGEENYVMTYTQNGMMSCYIEEDWYDIKSILIVEGDLDKFNDSELVLSSRDLLIYRGVLECEFLNGELKLSDNCVNKINFLLSCDWRLKLEILVVIWGFFIILTVVALLYEKRKVNLKTVVTLLATLFLLYGMSNVLKMNSTYEVTNFDIKHAEPSEIITKETNLLQQAKTDDAMLGIKIRFATYGRDVNGNYALTLYDANKEKLETVNFSGIDITDNMYKTIMFSKKYDAGEYYFSVNAIDNNDNDKLVIWYSASDLYTDGYSYIDGIECGKDWDFNLLIEGPNTKLICVILIIITYLLVMLLIWKEKVKFIAEKGRFVIYILAFSYAIFMLIFIKKYLYLGAFDEMAHISYLADVVKNPSWVPDYEKSYLLAGTDFKINENTASTVALTKSYGDFVGKWTNTVNYLGHPPLYYWLMTPLNAVHFDNDLVYINLDRLRIFNIVLTLIGIAIFLHIGYTRINKEKLSLHFLYASVIVTFPMVTYLGTTINNDNLAFLIAAVFMLGMLRFVENKRDKLTYFLIAVSISASAMTKLTLCIMLVICGLILAVKTLIDEKSLKKVFNKNFWWTLPVYLVVLIFYVCTYVKYGHFQITLRQLVSEEVFKTYTVIYKAPNERTRCSFFEFSISFIKQFLSQWSTGIKWNCSVGASNAINRIVFKFLWLSPFIILLRRKYKNEEKGSRNLLQAFSIALIITVILQFIKAFKAFQFISGHPGTQSRYYVCVMPLMIFAICYELQSRMNQGLYIIKDGKDNKMSIQVIFDLLAIALAILAIYGGGIYYLINTESFI